MHMKKVLNFENFHMYFTCDTLTRKINPYIYRRGGKYGMPLFKKFEWLKFPVSVFVGGHGKEEKNGHFQYFLHLLVDFARKE